MIENAQFVSIELDHFKFYYPVEQQCDKKHVGRVISMDSKYTVMKLNIFYRIGPLQDPVTWYGINYTGTHITQWDYQNKGKAGWTRKSSFVLKSDCVICVPV